MTANRRGTRMRFFFDLNAISPLDLGAHLSTSYLWLAMVTARVAITVPGSTVG
jgi:hypothetical protein